MTGDSERIGGYHTLALLTLLALQALLAFSKAGRHNVYTLISDIDVQSRLGVAPDSESSVIIADDLRKEAETFLSSIVLQVPEKGIGVITEGLLASTKPGSENVYSIISKLETEEKHSLLGDDQSPSSIRTELQKEAKSYFSSVLEDLPAEALTRLTPEDWLDQVGRHGDGVCNLSYQSLSGAGA